jgi:hypothetical protein
MELAPLPGNGVILHQNAPKGKFFLWWTIILKKSAWNGRKKGWTECGEFGIITESL